MSDIQIQPRPVATMRVFIVYIVALAIVLWLCWLLTGGGGELFEPKSDLYSDMPDASGLIVKAAVQLNGIQIGKISGISLTEPGEQKKPVPSEFALGACETNLTFTFLMNQVRVAMRVKTRYLPAIPLDSTISITADDLLGDRYLNIKSGNSTVAVQSGDYLHSILPIGDQFDSADLVAAMKDMLNRVDASIAQIEDSRTPIGSFVQTEDMYNNIRGEIVAVQQAVSKFAHPQSDFGKMLFTDELYQQIRAPIIAIDKQMAAMQVGEGQAGHFLASSDQYDKMRKGIADLRESLAQINAGQGAIGQFTQTDDTYRKIQQLVNTMGQIVDSVSAGDGRFGAMLADSQLYESLTGSTTEMQHLLGDFRANPRKYLRIKVF